MLENLLEELVEKALLEALKYFGNLAKSKLENKKKKDVHKPDEEDESRT